LSQMEREIGLLRPSSSFDGLDWCRASRLPQGGHFAHRQSTHSQRTKVKARKEQVSGDDVHVQRTQGTTCPTSDRSTSEAWGLHAGTDGDAQEAQLCSAQDRSCAIDQYDRGYGLHSGRRASLAGTLGGACARRPGQRSARCPLPHHPRCIGLDGCRGPAATTFEIRNAAFLASACRCRD